MSVPIIDPDVRALLDDKTLGRIYAVATQRQLCFRCGKDIRAGASEHATVLLLRKTGTDQVAIYYTHELCAASQIFDVAELPEPTDGAQLQRPTLQHRPVAFTARREEPAIVLAWDLDVDSDMEIDPLHLMHALSQEGMTSGRYLDEARLPTIEALRVLHADGLLRIRTRHGEQHFHLPDDLLLHDMVHLAAKTKKVVLVIGQELHLGGSASGAVDNALHAGRALAAIVPFEDPVLAKRRLRKPRKQRGRIGTFIVSTLPSSRRERLDEQRAARTFPTVSE